MKKYLIIIISAFLIVTLVLCGTLFNSCVSVSETEEKREQVRKLKEYLSSVEAETTFAVDNYTETVDNNKTPAKIDTEEAKQPFYTIGETATMQRSTIKLLEVKECSPKEEYTEPQDGYVFVSVKVEITNTTDSTHYATTDAAEAYCNDVLLDDSYYASLSAPGDEASGDIAPGKKLVGWFSFEAPADWEEIEVVYQDIGYFWSDKVTFKFAK